MKKRMGYYTFFLIFVLTMITVGGVALHRNVPENFNLSSGQEIEIANPLPITIKPDLSTSCISTNSQNIQKICCKGNAFLCNLIPIKKVNINLTPENFVVPCGTPFGVKMFTDGIVVVGLLDFESEKGSCNPAKESGIKKGDVIIEADNVSMKNSEMMAESIEKSKGNPLKLKIKRENETIEKTLRALKSSDDDTYKAGMWIRDSTAGIGTLTFCNPKNNTFSGLGHGICDVDTGEIVPLSHGEIIEASICSVIKGAKGFPGELKGYFTDSTPIGKIKENSHIGIFGNINKIKNEAEPIPIAAKHEVKRGAAKILTTIDGNEPNYYDISIESIDYDENNPTKNIMICIKDKELIEKTGGIVQGMSGSPIVQNNKLVGAITHVFVNNPKKGYAVFAEVMFNNHTKN